MNKAYISYISWIALAVGVLLIAIYFIGGSGNNINNEEAVLNPQSSSSFSPTPTLTPRPKSSQAPSMTPGLIVKEITSYDDLVKMLQKEGRHLALASDCSFIVPSNVNYYNNTSIMLDNTGSTERRILTIGGREYLLEAGEWFLTTLSSSNLPAQLPIYCGQMELGRIDLISN